MGPGRSALALLPFLLGIALLDVSSMPAMSPTYDEPGHLVFGKSLLEGRPIGPATQKMAVSAISYLPLLALDAAGVEVSDRQALFLARLPSVLFALGLAVLVFAWARRLYGLAGAVLATALYAVCPTVIAHSRLVTNDVSCACLTFASTMLCVRYLGRPTPGRLVLLAVVTGLAQLTKHTALLLFPIFAVLAAIHALTAHRSAGAAPGAAPRAVRRRVAEMLLAALVVLVVVNAGYLFRGTFRPARDYLIAYRGLPPAARDLRSLEWMASVASYLPDVPVPLPTPYLQALVAGVFYNATGSGHGPNYLLGELSATGWWYYFLLALALKTPLASILLFVAALALSRRWLRERPLDESALLVPVLVVLAFFSFGCTAQIGIRYVLPVLPFLCVGAGKLAVYTPPRYAAAYRGAVAVLVAWAAISSLSFHPHYLSYFNELIGDRKNMYRYLADSNVDWGQANRDLLRYLAAEGRGPVRVEPESPVSGRVVVSVNALVGVTAPRQRYAWLRDRFAPVDHVSYAWLVYEIPRE